MYRASSPIFDVPPLRRVKRPLPKRKRISESSVDPHDPSLIVSSPPLLSNATAEDIIAHADSLSAQMALQSYYMPILGGMQDFLKGDGFPNRTPTIDFGTGYGLADARSGGRADDEIGDGDYIDHLQQPGNTKKRKVPANMSGSRHGHHEIGLGNSGTEDEPGERGLVTGQPDPDLLDIFPAPAPSSNLPFRKGKMSAATLAGLQHKEMLKNRKRQLAAVLGALSHGDTLALDQALSARYPFGMTGDFKGTEPVRIRLSKRIGPRLARAAKAHCPDNKDEKTSKFPSRKFTFVHHSTTSERLVATREEVAILHNRFEAELARQAAKAAEAAKQAMSTITNAPNLKRAAGSKQGLNANQAINGRAVDQPNLDQQVLGPKRGGKKKKRSALANASNPHHLRNYVPSRLPNSGQPNANVNAQNYVGPPPLRFLSAQIPARQRKGNENVAAPTLTNPADEWICPFCEYKLFYGDEPGYTKSIKNRKKILKRRRRAQERVAAAASGKSLSTVPDRGDPIFDDGNREAEFEGPYAKDAVPGAAHKPPRWKTDVAAGGAVFDQQSHP